MPPSPSSNQLNKSFLKQLMVLGKTQQFYWFVGHLLTLICFILNLVESVFSSSSKYYRFCLINIIITYIIVVKQIHFKNRSSLKNLSYRTFSHDENLQYLFLSVWFYVASFKLGKVTGALYSFTIYSFFHFLNYFQNNLLQYLPLNLSAQQSINNQINNFTTNFNQYALMMASNSEIFIVISLVLACPLLIFKFFSQFIFVVIHVLTLFIVAGFLKLRYNNNVFTKQILNQYDTKVQQTLASIPLLAQFQPTYAAIKYNVLSVLNYVPVSKPEKSR